MYVPSDYGRVSGEHGDALVVRVAVSRRFQNHAVFSFYVFDKPVYGLFVVFEFVFRILI